MRREGGRAGPHLASGRGLLAHNVAYSYLYAFLMDLSLSAPIWVLYLRDARGFSLTQITLLEVPLFLLIVFAEVPTGAVADRFGRKTSLMLASGILAVSMFVYGVATSYPVILISNLFWGLAFTFRSGADVALLYDSLKEAGREDEFRRTSGRLFALRSTAMLAGLALGAPLAAATSYSFAIVATAALCAGSLPVALLMREPARAAEHASEPYLQTLLAGVWEAWRTPTLRWLFVFSGTIGACAAGPQKLLLQPWLAAHGVGTVQLGVWQGLVQAAEIFAALAAGRLLSSLGEQRSFLALPVVLFVSCAALGGIDRPWITAAFFGVAVAGGLHHPLLADSVNRRIESDRRATLLSVQSVAGNILMAVAWPLAGVAADTFGLRGPFRMYAIGTLALGGGALLLWDRAERESLGRALEPRRSP